MLHRHFHDFFNRALNKPLDWDVHWNFYKLLHYLFNRDINVNMHDSLNRNLDHFFNDNFIGPLNFTNLTHNLLHWNFCDPFNRNPNKLLHNTLPGPLHDLFNSPGNGNPNHFLNYVFMGYWDLLYLFHNTLAFNVNYLLNDPLLWNLNNLLNCNRLLHGDVHDPLNRVGDLNISIDFNLHGNLMNSFDLHNILDIIRWPTNLDNAFHWPFDGFCNWIRNFHFDRHVHNHFSLGDDFLGHLYNLFHSVWHFHLHRNLNLNFDRNLVLHRNMCLAVRHGHLHVPYMFGVGANSTS
mmetsp:Transcript_62142/g.110761  ORF Transcript_62142/g.110761 Transcript_62142/m.110761 type:complete len:293 (-) Transcript_62142:71-949(-)